MKLLTPEQVCEILGCGKTKLKSLPISYTKIGGNRRYKETDLQNYINQNTVVPEMEALKCGLSKGKTRRTGGIRSAFKVYDIEVLREQRINQPPKLLQLEYTSRNF